MSLHRLLFGIIFTAASTLMMLHAEQNNPPKIYALPKAMVHYKITGGGKLAEDVNLSIHGKGVLRFKVWGNVEFVDKEIQERMLGALHQQASRHLCEKHQGKQMLDVDFSNKKIMERNIPKSRKPQNTTEGLTFDGQQMVGNVVCDMWKAPGIRKCLYKGIPVFTEYRALGLYYREEATDMIEDINVSDMSQCSIPSYPVEKFSLYTKSFKTHSKKLPGSFEKRLKQSIEIFRKKGLNEVKLSDAQRQKLLNILAEPMFKTQKKMLPKLLETMKKMRACLLLAEETTEANRCLEGLTDLKSYFTDDMHNRIDDWSKEREGVLETLDEAIIKLQSKMKCIRGAKQFSDLAVCMKS